MPPAAKKDCQVILYDVFTVNRNLSKQCLLKLCFKKLFTESKDLFKLILTNTKTTRNALASRYGGYEHIEDVTDQPLIHNPQLVLEAVKNAEVGQADILESLEVAVNSLIKDFSEINGIVTLQLIFITDLSNFKETTNTDKLQEIIGMLQAENIYLYIIGSDIELPQTISNFKDIKNLMDNLKMNENNNNHLQLISKIIAPLERRVICNYQIGLNLIYVYKNWPGTQPWNVPLSVGTMINFPTQTVRIIKPGYECKLTAATRENTVVKYVDAEDTTITIPYEDIIAGISRHGKFVQITDEKMFKCNNPRSFNVLCFTESRNVPEYLLRGEGSYYVLSNGTEEENQMFEILVDCLAQADKYIVGRRVYNNNFAPKFVALIPKPHYNPKCFVLSELPCSDDVKIDYKEKDARLSNAFSSTVKDENIYDFLKSMDRIPQVTPLSINLLQDTYSAKVINKAADKLTGELLNLENVDLDYLVTPELVNDQLLKEVWKERELGQREADNSANNGDNSDEEFDF